jgi:hypothetical protein
LWSKYTVRTSSGKVDCPARTHPLSPDDESKTFSPPDSSQMRQRVDLTQFCPHTRRTMGVACFQNALTIFTRLVCLGFVVVAGIAIPQLLSLLDSTSPELDGTTLYVPLTVCESVSLQTGQPTLMNATATSSQNVSTTAENGTVRPALGDANCLDHDNSIIWTVIISLVFSMAAVAIFVLFGILADYKLGPFNKSAVLGMGLFLIFILTQSAICVWSLVSSTQYWESYYESRFQSDPSLGITDVKVYGSIPLLMATGGVAVGAAAFSLLDCWSRLCCKSNSDKATKATSQPAEAKQEAAATSEASEDVSSITDHYSSNTWANY